MRACSVRGVFRVGEDRQNGKYGLEVLQASLPVWRGCSLNAVPELGHGYRCHLELLVRLAVSQLQIDREKVAESCRARGIRKLQAEVNAYLGLQEPPATANAGRDTPARGEG